MKFYTSVNRYGNHILYRGFEGGEKVARRIPYEPTLFVPSTEDTGWKSLDGGFVAPVVRDSMRDAGDYLKQYQHVENHPIYGMTNYVTQYIADKFPDDIKFERDKVNVTTIDIEVASDEGFPHASEAAHPVIAITCKNNIDNIYYVWGLYDYDASNSIMQEHPVEYVKCTDEVDLLLRFLDFWNDDRTCPDIVTGWNSRLFDIPYLVNRVYNMIGRDHTKKFSPWGIVDRKDIVIAGRTNIAYEMLGIQQLDYYDLFRKFGYTYGAQESYKLDHIAHVVLGERKLSYDEYGSLHTLYKEDYQKFIDYNIKDVELVDRLEAKLDLITLAMTMAYRGGVNYSETFGTTSIWDAIIYRILNKKRIVVPPREDKIKHPYPGAYVKEPQVGMHDWVCSFDLNSLYPNIIVQYNMSPETIIEGKVPDVDVDKLLAGTAGTNSIDSTLAASGIRFRSDKPGIIPDVIRQYYQERVDIKERMLSAKQEYESSPSKKLENEIATLENQQMAIKILMNSLYGALGNNYFRYFDYRIAEAITTTGQLSIRWAERAINREMNKILKTVDDDYVIAIDTDSLYIRMQGLVDKFEPKDAVKFLDKFCEEHLEKILEKAYADLHELMNSVENRMVMKREAIADRGIWTAKKRYILNVHNNEGVQYTEPKLKVMGIEAVKSSTPQVCRDKLKEIFSVIINGGEAETQKFIADFRKEFCKLGPEEVSFPRGLSDMNKWAHRETIYSKATPIHVRGSLLYNHWIRKLDLLKKYEIINQGEKIKYCYLKVPNTIKENVISFNAVLPKELNLHRHIDYNMMYDKAFVEPLSTILDSIGWSVEPKATLEGFFA